MKIIKLFDASSLVGMPRRKKLFRLPNIDASI